MSGALATLAGLRELTGFLSPGLAFGLAALALAACAWAARRRPRALAWPAARELRASGARAHDPLRWLALALRAGALVLLAGALAGPLGPAPAVRSREAGLDLLLVLDTSDSMRALDAQIGQQAQTRLELAREVVERFALHRVANGDRVGLVVFGNTAFTHCPITSDGRLLRAALERVEPGMAGEATALGDALALAVKRLHALAGAGAGASPAAGQLVVLLTDGRSNADTVPPDVAAALAAQLGIRVHTVGIGGEGEVAMASPLGGRSLETSRQDLDAETLGRIAAATGGRFFRARSSADLAAVYEAIDHLERVERDAPPERLGEPAPEPLLAGAGLLLALELLAARVALRRIP
jgi:Ca-activated chloride channel family protein